MTNNIVVEDESTSELEIDTSSELQQDNPFEKELTAEPLEQKTFDDFNNTINEFDSLIDQGKVEEEKTWMDTIIDNKYLVFTTLNVLGICYGTYKFSLLKKQQVDLSKQLLENIERTKELDLNLFKVETYTKYLFKQQQNRWTKR